METKTFKDKKISFCQMTLKETKFAKEYLDFINSLIEEDAKILMNKKQTLKDEKDFITKAIKATKSEKKVFIIAKDGKKVVANTSIELGPYKRSHIGKFGIAVRNGYRGIGLGKYIMAEILSLAKKQLPGLKIFQLEVYENNKPAIALYKKMGFKVVGHIPKQVQHKGKIIGEYLMIKPVK